MRVLSATVTRTSRSGRVLGPEHRVPVATALKALTIWPAWQHFEEGSKGTIEVGKLGDFVILSDNPMTVPQERLAELKVLETIKEGVSIISVRRAPRQSRHRPCSDSRRTARTTRITASPALETCTVTAASIMD